ncbi:MAG TPA: Gfo/Idh/MocA family oxidoreductase [Chloroflexota bacterium]|nr:Gfo/Idh/MocA family oxidoreductase [Chloroflexota bacterium]
MANYRAAVVGLTGIGMTPARPASDPVLGLVMPHSHVSAYATVPNTTVVAVCDLVPALLDKFRADWGPVLPEARTYTDYRELLAKEQVDLLSIVTSDHRHAQIAVDAVAAGVKGIFCEKPIATTLADADRMIEACAAHNVPLAIDHTRRWYPEFVEARRLVRSGAIGPLRRIVAHLGGPRAMLFRNGTHLIDAVCYFAESDPAWLVGELDDEHRAHPPRYAGDGGRDPATDPGASALIHFQNGVRAHVNASKGTMGNFEIDLVGETGRLRVGTHVAEIWRPLENGQPAVSQIRAPHTTKGDMVAAIEEIIGLIEHGGTGSSTGEDGRRVLSILLGILQSNAAGGTPIQFPIRDL